MDPTLVNQLAYARYQEILREAELNRRFHMFGTKRTFWNRVRTFWNARQRHESRSETLQPCQPCPEAA